ncbi:unnamed protein product [Timema podura]|uniref:WAP domain-containing protein n=1 Tax=Timema podura TaxID=61482 RepID=A0ABN7NSR1_TIMPD|nr:unnamed protein product [Timema podura]
MNSCAHITLLAPRRPDSPDKPGHCPSPTRDINQPDPTDLWCLTSILHECYGDMDCPGSKKCCQYQCYYVCVAPGID